LPAFPVVIAISPHRVMVYFYFDNTKILRKSGPAFFTGPLFLSLEPGRDGYFRYVYLIETLLEDPNCLINNLINKV